MVQCGRGIKKVQRGKQSAEDSVSTSCWEGEDNSVPKSLPSGLQFMMYEPGKTTREKGRVKIRVSFTQLGNSGVQSYCRVT